MSQYTATFTVKLDDSEYKAKIKDIEDKKIEIKVDVKPDVSNIESDIQKAAQKIVIKPKIDFDTKGNGSKSNNTLSRILGTNKAEAEIAKLQKTLSGVSNSGHNQIPALSSYIDQLNALYEAFESTQTTKGRQNLSREFNGILDQAKNLATVIKSDLGSSIDIVGNKFTSSVNGLSSSTMSKFKNALKDFDTGETAKKLSLLGTTWNKTREKLGNRISNQDQSSLTEYGREIDNLRAKYRQFTEAMQNDDKVAAVELFDELTNGVKRTQNALTELGNQQKWIDSTNLQGLQGKLEDWLGKNTKNSDYRSGVKSLSDELNSYINSGGTTEESVKRISSAFKELDVQATAAGAKGKSVGQTFKDAFSNVVSYFSAYNLINYGIQGLKSMAQEVLKVDTAMTELRKVTNETGKSYSEFQRNAAGKAKEIGATVSDYITSTADFARLGYDFKQSQSLAKVASIYNVVGDDVGGIDNATSHIISTMKAFNVQADDSISIVDKLNEVSNNYAISSGGIGEALARSASSLSTGRNDIDQSIAMITAANEIMQNPEKVGNGLKTISMRIRGAESELEEAGESTEGMAKSTAKLRSEIKSLAGIDIMLDENTFKSTYDIMDELSKKWGDLTDITQANITELLAGKNQGNLFSSLLTNFDVARKALETSRHSEGSAYTEHEKAMDSLEGKINQFKASWQSLSMSVMGSDFLKGIVDSGTGALSLLDGLIDKCGLLGSAIIGIAGGYTIKKGMGELIKQF